LAAEYRPFATLHGKEDEEVVRPSHYGLKNQPLSLEVEHKRSVHTNSKSVQKPKKGILKQSSSYLEDSSQKKKQLQFKPPTSKAA